MTDPDFPFEADFDAAADDAARGPLDRRDLVVTSLIAAAGALLVAVAGVIAVLELAIAPELGAVLLTGAGPFAAWTVGATLALIRLVRRRRRAFLPMLIAIGIIVVFAVVGILWWLAAAEMV